MNLFFSLGGVGGIFEVEVDVDEVVVCGWIWSVRSTVQFDSEIKMHESLHKVQSPLHQSENSKSHSEHEFALWPPQFTPSKINSDLLKSCTYELFFSNFSLIID